MPASMISADTGGSAYVAGSSIAMVATGPMPGSTPISVPRMHPTRQYSRLVKVKATPKPVARLWNSSMAVCSSTRNESRPDLDLELERPDEGHVAAGRQDGRQHQHVAQLEVFARHARDDGERVDRDDHPHGGKA